MYKPVFAICFKLTAVVGLAPRCCLVVVIHPRSEALQTALGGMRRHLSQTCCYQHYPSTSPLPPPPSSLSAPAHAFQIPHTKMERGHYTSGSVALPTDTLTYTCANMHKHTCEHLCLSMTEGGCPK